MISPLLWNGAIVSNGKRPMAIGHAEVFSVACNVEGRCLCVMLGTGKIDAGKITHTDNRDAWSGI